MRFVALVSLVACCSATLAHGQDAMPANHPPTGETDGRVSNPHALMEGPKDGAREDDALPRGTVRIRVRSAKGEPVVGQNVILGLLENTVAKGERREQFTKLTDATGDVVFDNLKVNSAIAYRVRTLRDGAVFFAPPFNLGEAHGTNVLIHVYPVTRNVEDAQLAFEAVLFSELRDDRIQFDEVFTIDNMGSTAWLAEDIPLALPKDATGFNAQQSMSDQAIVQVTGRGATLKGTFPPGEHQLSFRWQLPLHNESEVFLSVGLPPQVVITRVGTTLVPGLSLSVDDMPPAKITRLQDGSRALLTERSLKPKEKPMRQLDVKFSGLPASGLGRAFGNVTYEVVAGVVAFLIALSVLIWSLTTAKKNDSAASREAILRAIADLDSAHARGDIGPKSHEHLRRELLDQLALMLLSEKKAPAKLAV